MAGHEATGDRPLPTMAKESKTELMPLSFGKVRQESRAI